MITDHRTVAEMLAERLRLSPEAIDQAIARLDNSEIMQRLNAEAQLAKDAIAQLMAAENTPAQMDALQTAIKHSNAVKDALNDLAAWTERAKHGWITITANAANISHNVYWNTPPAERTWIR